VSGGGGLAVLFHFEPLKGDFWRVTQKMVLPGVFVYARSQSWNF
jgi:hypothetical protein